MDCYDVKRLGLIFAVQAEIEGMKADNLQREHRGESLAWDESSFYEKAVELKTISYCHNEQL